MTEEEKLELWQSIQDKLTEAIVEIAKLEKLLLPHSPRLEGDKWAMKNAITRITESAYWAHAAIFEDIHMPHSD